MLTLLGRVRSVREAGKKLLFIDIIHNEARLQVMANLGGLQKDVGYSTEELQRFRKLIKTGDYFCEFESFVAIVLSHMTDNWESIPRLSCENLSRRTLPLLDRVT
jgi:lysyl-tRNA synthetase class II